MWCRCYPETVIWRNLSGHACGIRRWLLSTIANLARNCGFCLALSSFMWLMLSKRCSTLHLISPAAACERAMCCIVRKKLPTLKKFRKVDVGQSSEKGALFPGRETKALELFAGHDQGSLGRAHTQSGFVTLLFPSSLGPQICICFYPRFYACVILVNVRETWVLNFVRNTDLLLWCCKTSFIAPLSFQKSKENYGFPLRHIFGRSLKATYIAGDF